MGAKRVTHITSERVTAESSSGGYQGRNAAEAETRLHQPSGSRVRERVSFFEFVNRPPHLETAFEMVHRHLSHGAEVTYRFLGHDVPRTAFLPPLPGSTLLGPWLPERRAARLVAHPRFTFVPRSSIPLGQLPFDVPGTLEGLMNLRYGDFDVGMGVASTFISMTGNSRFQPSQAPGAVSLALRAAIAVFEFVSATLEAEKPNLVYLFNGRFAFERAVLRACQNHHVPYLVHERGSAPDRFFLRPFTPHDRVRVQDSARATWSAVGSQHEAVDVAEHWYHERRQGQPRDWPSFTSKQKRAQAPELIADRRVVAYFSSSDDEYVAIGDEFRWKGWTSQLDAVRALIRVVEQLDDTQLVLRVHPHLTKKHASERARWMALAGSSPTLSVIAPESEVDTYAVMDAADIVVTGGSTVGAEATYWGRPSILLGPSDYDELGAAHIARDEATLRRLLREHLEPAAKDAALAYAYYRATFGEQYVAFQPDGFHRGTFMGVHLRPWLWRMVSTVRQEVRARFDQLRELFA